MIYFGVAAALNLRTSDSLWVFDAIQRLLTSSHIRSIATAATARTFATETLPPLSKHSNHWVRRMHLSNPILLALAWLRVANALPQAEEGSVNVGPYEVINCGRNQQKIAAALKELFRSLQIVIADTLHPPASPAFTAFFKDIASRGLVHDTLQFITTGEHNPNLTPHLICVTGPNQLIATSGDLKDGSGVSADLYLSCVTRNSISVYVQRDNNEPTLAVLCPALFHLAPMLPSTSTASCLRVDHHFNRFIDHGERLHGYLMWGLFSVLLQAYTNDLDYIVDPNACFRLSASAAVNNAFSWLYYAASIRLGCTDFPRNMPSNVGPPTRDNGVELLEIDGTSSAYRYNGTSNQTSSATEQNLSIIAIHAQNVSFSGALSEYL